MPTTRADVKAFAKELQDLCNKYQFEIDHADGGSISINTSYSVGNCNTLKPAKFGVADVWVGLEKGKGSKPYHRPLFECTGKGGEYELIGLAKPAGEARKMNFEEVQVYRDNDTGKLYYRHPSCWAFRMTPLP